jgi:hypothetical protein
MNCLIKVIFPRKRESSWDGINKKKSTTKVVLYKYFTSEQWQKVPFQYKQENLE